jgi:hypothetical protein
METVHTLEMFMLLAVAAEETMAILEEDLIQEERL